MPGIEFALSDLCGDHRSRIGFWGEMPILNQHLEEPLPPTPISLAPIERTDVAPIVRRRLAYNAAQVNRALAVGRERIAWLSSVARAYTGWLITNGQFLQEHDNLMQAWAPQIRRWRLQGVGRLLVAAGPVSLARLSDEDAAARLPFDEAVREFLIRWRLAEIVAPDMPVPHTPVMHGQVPISVVDQIARAGGVFSYPDTFPVPSRDQLRNMVVNANRPDNASDHLAEWYEITSPRNSAKNQLDRFARFRTLCHYWRVLCTRHAANLHRKTDGLNHALGEHLGVSENTIRADVRRIRSRLG